MSDKVSRRQFAKLAGLSAAGIANPLEAAETKPAPAPRGVDGFPAGFVWGTATSSYQVEGAVDVDGRGASIWDKFVRIPGKIEDGTTGDRAVEHYRRYKEDIALIKELGCKAYRFSVAWPRVFPDGDGKPRSEGARLLQSSRRRAPQERHRAVADALSLGPAAIAPGSLRRLALDRDLQDLWRLCGLCRRAPDRSRQERVHAERERTFRPVRLWPRHRRARRDAAASGGQPGQA